METHTYKLATRAQKEKTFCKSVIWYACVCVCVWLLSFALSQKFSKTQCKILFILCTRDFFFFFALSPTPLLFLSIFICFFFVIHAHEHINTQLFHLVPIFFSFSVLFCYFLSSKNYKKKIEVLHNSSELFLCADERIA